MQQAVLIYCDSENVYGVHLHIIWSMHGLVGVHYITGYEFYLHLTMTHAMMSPDAPTNTPMMINITPVMRGAVQPVQISPLVNRIHVPRNNCCAPVPNYQHDHPYNNKRGM